MSADNGRAIPLFERLELETQSHCNRACWFCPRIYDRTGAYLDHEGEPVVRQMATEKVLDILDQAASLQFTGGVSFYFYSEGLLDKRNVTFAREARTRGMKPYLHTNGDALRSNPALLEAVREVYDYIVIGLYDYETDAELEEGMEFWRRHLVHPDLRFSTIGNGPPKSARTMATPRALVPSSKRFNVPDFKYDAAPCHRPLIRLIIRHDGRMAMCCEDVHADFDFGNVHEATLEELWFSERHVRIVNDLIAGRRALYGLCRNCPLPPSGPAPEGQRIKIERRA
jgi:2-deoxy-scyllo-inosamine dehydrogenase (SAM-dependent)/8-amino-3,8-dideoxy-alpha-D-manno-octulosonate transaminase